MTETLATDPTTSAHSKAFEDAYQAVTRARRALYAQAVAYVAHLIRAELTEVAFIGELGLDGQVRPVSDVNEAARSAIAAGCTTALIPDANMSDIDVPDISIYSAENLDQAVRVLQTFDRANS